MGIYGPIDDTKVTPRGGQFIVCFVLFIDTGVRPHIIDHLHVPWPPIVLPLGENAYHFQ